MKQLLVTISCLLVATVSLAQNAVPFSHKAVFLLDTSIGSDPAAYGERVEQLIKVLEKDASIKRFQVVLFDSNADVLGPNWLDNDAATRTDLAKRLAAIVPEGACDIEAGLRPLTGKLLDLGKRDTVRVFLLSEGWTFLGESEPARLATAFQRDCPYQTQFACLARKQGGGNVGLFSAFESPMVEKAKSDSFAEYVSRLDARVKLFEGKHGEHVKLLVKALTESDLRPPQPRADERRGHESAEYLKARGDNLFQTALYIAEAKKREEKKQHGAAVRALTSLLPLFPTNIDVQRSVGYRLLDAREHAYAVRLFQRVQSQKPEEPHSYRDLARALEDAGMLGLAALQYETLLAGQWDNKYTSSFKEVVLEEYAHMMRDAIRRKTASAKLIDLFGERLETVDPSKLQADLRVTISWNTDNTDVDLWVIEPSGEKCFYAYQKTKSGGELTQDVTQGYGPERYQMIKAGPGEYRIVVHFYSGPRNQQVVEGTHVNVVVRRNAGTPQEESQRHTVILRNRNDLVDVVRMKY